MLLIAQIIIILRNEPMKAISTGYIIVKAARCLGNYAANNPHARANASDSDCLQHNFLATVL